MDAELLLHFVTKVYVVGHHIQFGPCSSKFLSGWVDDLLQTHIHVVDQGLAAVFGAPDHMILAGLDDVTLVLKSEPMFYIIRPVLYNARPKTRRCASPPLIPRCERRGFTADLGNSQGHLSIEFGYSYWGHRLTNKNICANIKA